MKQWINRMIVILYCLIIFYVLFGRRIQYGGLYFSGSMWEYAKMYAYLIPFKTIGKLVAGAKEGTMGVLFVLKNLLGNLVLFFPMGMYWGLRKKKETIGMFLIKISVILLAIELVQFLSKLGSFDVDDFILNLAGGLGGFWLGNKIFLQTHEKHPISPLDK